MPDVRRFVKASWIALALVVAFAVAAHGQQPGAGVVSADVARKALEEAIRYAEVTYEFQGEQRQGVAYLWGGRMSVDAFLQAVREGKEPGVEAGADASAVVVNAYRAADPGIRFAVGSGEAARFELDANSRTLYDFNVRFVPVEELRPGDLIFFSGEGGEVAGVGVFERREGPLVHFVVASASAGRVIRTFLNVNNEYWRTRFLAAGQLLRMAE